MNQNHAEKELADEAADKPIKKKRKKSPMPPKPEDFDSRQMSFFQDFLCNTVVERDSLSNAFDLWDSIPRYVISRQQQDKWRKTGSFPLLHKVPFRYRGRELIATIQPAAVEGKDGTIRSYFPSANEELIEDVLRKFSADQNSGYYDQKDRRCGVIFTLYMVRKELERRGHARTYNEITLSLEIMSSAVIRTATTDEKTGKFTSKSLYLNNLFRVSKDTLAEDQQAKWFADFHPFVSHALDELTYRQFNYARLMSHKSQLARWLNKVLSLKYLNASFLQPFEIRLSTIIRDSGLLYGYARQRKAIEAVDAAFDELKDCQPPLLGNQHEKKLIQGPRNKIVDVVYILHPTREFVAEVKAASRRRTLAEEAFLLVDNSLANPARQGV